MAEITMPKLSDTMTEGTLVRWKKQPGEEVTMGEVIAEVETDKATMEMEAFEDGVLSEVFVQEGQKVQVGQKIARIGSAGEAEASGSAEPAAAAQEAAAAKSASDAGPAAVETKTDGAPKAPAPEAASKESASTSAGRLKVSPLARKIALEHGINLSAIQGTGPGERIIQRDVLAAVEADGKQQRPAAPAVASQTAGKATSLPSPAPVPSKPSAGAPAFVLGGADQRQPLSSMRKVIADRLLASKTQIPHFYLRIEVDAGPLVKLRSEINAASEKEGVKYSLNDFVLKAAVAAIVRVPKVNASFEKDAIVQFGSVHLAVAVAIDEGLITPVIRDAQNKSLRDISLSVKDLASRARLKKLKPDEYQGGTFTVSNLGAYGIDAFDAIINPPQAAILSVGALVKKPVVNERDEIAIGHRLHIGLSCDHRVVDGAVGAEYLSALRRMIEHPALMLV